MSQGESPPAFFRVPEKMVPPRYGRHHTVSIAEVIKGVDELFLLIGSVADKSTQALTAYGLSKKADLKHVTDLSSRRIRCKTLRSPHARRPITASSITASSRRGLRRFGSVPTCIHRYVRSILDVACIPTLLGWNFLRQRPPLGNLLVFVFA